MNLSGAPVLVLLAIVPFVSAPAPQSNPAAAAGHPLVKPDDDGAACLACHKDIAGRTVVHAPVAAEDCRSCHSVAPKGAASAIGLVRGAKKDDTRDLCTSCHDEFQAKLKDARPHEPVASGDCVSCHDPHGSPVPSLLTGAQGELCTTCHDAVAEAVKAAVPHQPAVVSCTICHDPHGARFERQREAGVNGLCRACHASPNAKPAAAEASKALARPLAENEMALLSRAKPIVLDANGTRGHPLDGHPVAGMADSNDPKRPLTCVSCHDPHGAASAHLLPRGATGQMELCVECHK